MSDSGTVNVSAAAVIMVPTRPEEMFPVRIKEWARLREKLSALKRSRRQWSNLGWALIGIGASAFLSWLPYMLTKEAGGPVAVLTIVVGAVGLGTGLIALLAAKDTHRSLDQTVREIRVHMHDMESSLTDEQRTTIKELAAIVMDD